MVFVSEIDNARLSGTTIIIRC